MTKHGKKYVEAEKQIPAEPVSPLAAMKLLKEISVANFDETVTGDFRLGIDTRQADQQLRGTVSLPIGYKEIVEALDGNITLEEAVQAIKTATRRYGKRQRTWFRRDKRIRWVNADVGDAEAVAAEILSQLETLDAYHG